MATSTLLERGARHQLHLARRGLLPYIDAVRNAHQIGVFEFDAGTLVSVIEQHVKPCRFKLVGNLLAGLRAGSRRPRWLR